MSKKSHAKFEISQGAVIENDKGEVLILKLHNNGWVLPGGHLDKNEDWLDGLKREIFEETGIKNLSIANILGVSIFGSCYGICFHCITIDTEITLSHEHDAFVWVVSKEDLEKYEFYHVSLKNFAQQVIESLICLKKPV